MGNPVTNRINFERRDGATGIEAFADALGKLTPTPLAEIASRLANLGEYQRSIDVPFEMSLLRPVPDSVKGLGDGSDKTLLGLALLSTPKRDLVMMYWESSDPASNDMPPKMVMTAHSVLAKHGLADMGEMMRRNVVMMRHMDALDAGRVALAAYEETGKFDAVTWQTGAWGTRAHADDIYLWLEQGNLCVKFDTVNEGPAPWLESLAEALPGFQFTGVSYDEDTDYSLHFVTDEPGEISIEECNDEGMVLQARAFVSGMTVQERLEEDKLIRGEDFDDDEDGCEPG